MSSMSPRVKQTVTSTRKPQAALVHTDVIIAFGKVSDASLISSANHLLSANSLEIIGKIRTHMHCAIISDQRCDGGRESNKRGSPRAVPGSTVIELSEHLLRAAARTKYP